MVTVGGGGGISQLLPDQPSVQLQLPGSTQLPWPLQVIGVPGRQPRVVLQDSIPLQANPSLQLKGVPFWHP